MNGLRNVLFATATLAGVGLAERVTDPFDRHETSDYAIWYNVAGDDLPLSVNRQDTEGELHDDPVGDILLVTTTVSALGSYALWFVSESKRLEAEALA